MSNYTKSTNFATKDNLTPGDPLKIVRGTEIDTEFNNIATAIATKTDNASAAITGGTINDTTIGATTASTGAFTTISATGAITSTLATGTAPLVVASTTKVTNLNVDSLDGADWASPAALGSTTPAAVSATTLAASGNVTFSGGTANGVAYLNGSKVVTSGSALVFDGTNLGIGTSSPAAKLEVRGADAAARFRGSNIQYLDVIATSGGAVRLDANNGNAFVFAQNTTEQMRLDTSGNLGLGVTPSAWDSSFKALQVSNISLFSQDSTGAGWWSKNARNVGGTWYYIGTGFASYIEQGAGAFKWNTSASGTAGNAITFNTPMTLDVSGNLLLGGTVSRTRLTVQAGEGNAPTLGTASGGAFFGNSSSAYGTLFGTSGSGYGWIQQQRVDGTATAYDLCLQPSGGNLLVGTTSDLGGLGGKVQISSAGSRGLVQSVNANVRLQEYLVSGSTVGFISTDGTNTTYSTSSDYRLKNTIAPMTGALAKVAQLKPVTYKWNADGSNGQGFIAHELAEVCPQAVTGEKDGTRIEQYEISPAVAATYDEDGNELTSAIEAVMGEREVPQYQGIDVSFLVATLTAAIQELKAEFDAYKASHP